MDFNEQIEVEIRKIFATEKTLMDQRFPGLKLSSSVSLIFGTTDREHGSLFGNANSRSTSAEKPAGRKWCQGISRTKTTAARNSLTQNW